jgi:DNA polymerase I
MRMLVIDCNHLSGRCHAALGELRRQRDGHYSGVVHGVLQGLSFVKNKLRIQFQDMIAVWDGGRCKRRVELYPEYKQNRKWSRGDDAEIDPEEVIRREGYYAQIEALHQGLATLGIRQVKVRGAEADDILGILSRFYEDRGHLVTIYTGDYDLHQCVSPKVDIFDPRKELLTKQDVEALWQLPVEQFVPYKAIVGDSSDNIKGIKGMGEVRAKRTLAYYRLPGFADSPGGFADLESIPAKDKGWVQRVLDNADVFERNRELMTIPRTLVNWYYTDEQDDQLISQLHQHPKQNSPAFIEFLREWELKALLDQVGRWL